MADKWNEIGGAGGSKLKWAAWLWKALRALSSAPLLVQIAVAAGALYVLFSLLGFLSRLFFWAVVIALIAIAANFLWSALTKGKGKLP